MFDDVENKIILAVSSTLQRRRDLCLLCIFFIHCVFIILAGYYLGKLNPDSTYYLGIATRISEDFNFNMSFLYNCKQQFFSHYPLGYPFLIAFISKITNLTVFWSSKILNCLVIGLILILIKQLFNKSAVVLALVTFHYNFMEMSHYTMSEVTFLGAILLLMYSFLKITHNRESIWFVIFFLSMTMIPFIRYIGIYIYLFIFIITCISYLRDEINYIKVKKIAILCGFSISLYIIYLCINFYLTGHITGYTRKYLSELSGENYLILNFFENFFRNMNFLWIQWYYTAILFGVLIFLIKHFRIRLRPLTQTQLFLILSAITYLFVFAVIKALFISTINDFNARILIPVVFPLTLALVDYFYKHIRLSVIMFLLVISSLNLTRFISYNIQVDQPFYKNEDNVLKKYSQVPSNSLIIEGHPYLNYLRKDVEIIYKYNINVMGLIENEDEFIFRVKACDYDQIYFDSGEEIQKIN